MPEKTGAKKGGRKKKTASETIWLSEETYKIAKRILGSDKIYYTGMEGVSFDVAKGAWRIIGEPVPVKCPPGYGERCVIVATKLSINLGIDPFVVEERFVFKGISGRNIKRGRIEDYTYVLLAYDRSEQRFLTLGELEKTLLYKNYLSDEEVQKTIQQASKHLKREWWHVERMRKEALSKYKVVWRDVAKEFIPAVDFEGAVPDHNVHYVVTQSPEEAYYLMSILLAPQINAVVRELSPWIGHVQPRFLRYFRIPKYDPSNKVHRKLADIGRRIHINWAIKEIESLIEKL